MRTRLTVLAVAIAATTLLAAAPGMPTPAAAPADAPDPAAAARALAGDRVLAAAADLEAPPRATGWLAGEAIHVAGTVGIHDVDTGRTLGQPLAVQLRVDGDPSRAVDVVADESGVFTADLPGALTAGLAPGVHALTVHATDGAALDRAEATAATFAIAASADGTTILRHQFVSSTGWVKPGEAFPLTTRVQNTSAEALTDVTVTVAAPPSVTFTGGTPLDDAGIVEVEAATITWQIDEVPAGDTDAPGEVVLVTDAQAADLTADRRLVWKDLSSTATLTGAGEPLAETSHGPKVIPPSGGFETARYGDKPFPMVPVQYVDRAPQDGNDPAELDTIVNSPDFPGSTFNLYQEMSYGQLYPQGVVPSADIAGATFSEVDEDMPFTTPEVPGACRGATFGSVPELIGSPAFDTRIENGWYQLPGTTEYYGGDSPAFTLGAVGAIDSACGQLGKGVYDAASVADPDIDYNHFDSDRDGVVDFFMLIFVGCGGNGASQIPLPETPATNELCPYTDAPYDNIWPHSSSLTMQYKDEETGLRGFISSDQLRSLTEVPQCFLDDTHTAFDDCAEFDGPGRDDLPVPVRVGPYNVNPETVFESASVISHEYGHHLGLPDFYNASGAYDAYSSYNLMAADYGQHMTVFSKQDLGWIVPRVLQPGQEETVAGWDEVRTDIGEIHWQTPDGDPYVLRDGEDGTVRNGLAWTAKLPSRQVIDPALVAEQASGSSLLWSGRGNDFGCSPTGGHNVDIWLPELTDVPEGADVRLTMTTAWDIEWDWDYGFVLTTTDGASYTSVPSDNGYTTSNTYDPNGQQCFSETDNGLTGQSGAYAQGEPAPTLARNPAANDYSAPLTFVEDSYDISALVGADNPVARLSYFTDAAFDRPGWFVDDVVVTVDGEELFRDDFEDGLDDNRFIMGGCGRHGFDTAVACTDGWMLIDAEAGDTRDHAYYLELRDRASFDFEGRGQSDRGVPTWEPGLFVEYTDENHGYGNNGVPEHPAQHYLDSQPEAPTSDELDPVLGKDYPACPEDDESCDDVSFTPADGDTTFSDAADDPHLDNFAQSDGIDERWTFDYGCLTAEVLAMRGHDTVQEEADLTADVRLAGGQGCQFYDVAATAADGTGTDDLPVQAVISVRETRVRAGTPVPFDGSGSQGDDLTYAWDLGDGTTADTETVTHTYDRPGRYEVTLTVTDGDDPSDSHTDRVTMQVIGAGAGANGPSGGGDTPPGRPDDESAVAAAAPLPTTGGGAALLALALLGVARTTRSRRH